MKNNRNEMVGMDVLLSNTTDKMGAQKNINTKVPHYKSMPLASWDIYMENYHNMLAEAKKNVELQQVNILAKKYKWQNNFTNIFAQHEYEALIITDINQYIIWVNEGFSEMTGYSQKFALQKTPSFLQGKLTCIETKNRIREKIKQNTPFKEIITNYKKDQTTYKCEVNIIPLYGNETTHYIALEKQVRLF